jgi:hypothetical protein
MRMRHATREFLALGLLVSARTDTALADPPQTPGPAVLQISAEPPVELGPYDRHFLQQSCLEQLPGLVATLGPGTAQWGDYETHVHVLAADPVLEHLERTPEAEAMLMRAAATIEHGLRFWEQEALQPPAFQFLVMTGAPGAEAQMGAYPADPRVFIQIYRKRGRRLRGKVEVHFERGAHQSFDLAVDQIRGAQFSRNAQWGTDPHGKSVTRFARTPIWWSVDKPPPIPALVGSGPALEILRLQLSPYTDACKRRVFEADEKQHGRVDIHRVERMLWRLDQAENAVVIAVASAWLLALASEHGHRLAPAELAVAVNMDAPGVAQLVAKYSPASKGVTPLLAAYTSDPAGVADRLGRVLDP